MGSLKMKTIKTGRGRAAHIYKELALINSCARYSKVNWRFARFLFTCPQTMAAVRQANNFEGSSVVEIGCREAFVTARRRGAMGNQKYPLENNFSERGAEIVVSARRWPEMDEFHPTRSLMRQLVKGRMRNDPND